MVQTLYCIAWHNLWRLDILVWVAGVFLALLAIGGLLWQNRQYRRLRRSMDVLSKLNLHTVEYDLVLKAMRLAIWHVDLRTNTLSFGTDYRESTDNAVIPPNTSLEAFFQLVEEPYSTQLREMLEDLRSGRVDNAHGQYRMRVPHTQRNYWGETFITVEHRDLTGRPLTLVGASVRIDRQKALEEQLIEARNKAEESDRLKSAFLANMSHEIRTPLNAIVGFSDVLPSVQDEGERQHLMDLIRENNAHLLRLFDDMVNMSKLEAGETVVRREHFSVKQFIDDQLERYEDKALEKNLFLHSDVRTDDATLYTDKHRLGEILHQYIDNALKFTTEGGVTIGYDIKADSIRLWVRDTGIGIDENHLGEHLFDRFVKIDEFVPGTGLGLSICRRLALSLDGKVGVESQLGEGSCFWVELPNR